MTKQRGLFRRGRRKGSEFSRAAKIKEEHTKNSWEWVG